MKESTTTRAKEVTVGAAIRGIQYYVKAGLRRWPVTLAVSFVFGLLLAYYISFSTPIYTANLSFLINESNQGAGMSSILGQIGFGGSSSEFNLKKIVALSNSELIVNGVLLDSIVIDSESDLVVNHLLALPEVRDQFEITEDVELSSSDFDRLSPQQRLLLRAIYYYCAFDPGKLSDLSIDEDSGILTLSTSSENEALSIHFNSKLYERLSSFYRTESVGNKQLTVNRLKAKVDSIKNLLESTEYRLAQVTDTRLGLIQERDRLLSNRLTRELSFLTIGYGEVLRNLEAASFALSTQTPFFRVIDYPYLPLPKQEKSEIWYGIGGMIFVASLIFFGRVAVEFAQVSLREAS